MADTTGKGADSGVSPDKRRSKERSIDDYKRKIWKLKKELEEYRETAKRTKDKELEDLRVRLNAEKTEALESLKLETRNDLLQMHTKFTEKEVEWKTLIRQKDEEAKAHRQHTAGHRQEIKEVKDAIESAHHETVSKLHREIKHLKQLNLELQQKYQAKQQEYKDKVSELKLVQDEAEQERQKLLKDALTVKLTRLKNDQEAGGVKVSDGARERDNQQKVLELTTALKRLEKRSSALKEENTALRKTESNFKDMEEQCAKLKKRNAELVALLKGAEEKNQKLHVDSRKSLESAESSQGIDHIKKVFARQRAKDFAEHSKNLLSKDKEIQSLTQKNMSLADNLSNHVRVSTLSQIDMSAVLRLSTKERLALEMRAKNTGGDDAESKAVLFNLRVDHEALQERYADLLEIRDRLEQELESVKQQVTALKQELAEIKAESSAKFNQLKVSEQACKDLSNTKSALLKDNTALSGALEKLKVERIRLVEELKCSEEKVASLIADQTQNRETLQEVTQLRADNVKLRDSVKHTDTLTHQVMEQEAKFNQIKTENSVLSRQLNELQEVNRNIKSEVTELRAMTIPSLLAEKQSLHADITKLQVENDDLREEKEELMNLINENEDLTSQIAKLKLENLSLTEQLSEQTESADKAKFRALQHADLEFKVAVGQREKEVSELQSQLKHLGCLKSLAEEAAARASADHKLQIQQRDEEIAALKARLAQLIEQNEVGRKLSTETANKLNVLQNGLGDSQQTIRELKSQLTEKVCMLTALAADIEKEREASREDAMRRDELSAKINHENCSLHKQLNESREMLKHLESEHYILKEDFLKSKSVLHNNDVQLMALAKKNSNLLRELQVLQKEGAMLSQDKIRIENVCADKEKHVRLLSNDLSELKHEVESLSMKSSEASAVLGHRQSELDGVKAELSQVLQQLATSQSELLEQKSLISSAKKEKEALELLAKKKLLSLKQELMQSYESKLEELSKNLEEKDQLSQTLSTRLSAAEEELEDYHAKQISVYAGSNCYHLYVARHTYDPSLNTSDNSNNSAVMVDENSHPALDENGDKTSVTANSNTPELSLNAGDYVFVSGELTEDGYHEARLLDGRAGLIPSQVLEPLYEFDIYGFVVATEPDGPDTSHREELSEFSSGMFNDSSILPSAPRLPAPYPRKLTLERQFANSILVGWEAPQTKDNIFIYHIYVDDRLRASVKGACKCKALVEGVKAMMTHRVYVTATTVHGESDWRHCTMVIGEPTRPPTDLDIVVVNSDTARLTFLPHNSNQHHYIYINNEFVRNLGPGIFQVDIAGLIVNTEYEVIVASEHSESTNERSASFSSSRLPFSLRKVFTMPATQCSVCEEPDFLELCDQFLGARTDTPAATANRNIESGFDDVDFLKDYDANMALSGVNGKCSPSRLPHSTPKVMPSYLAAHRSFENDLSPIVIDSEIAADGNTENIDTRNLRSRYAATAESKAHDTHQASGQKLKATMGHCISPDLKTLESQVPEGQESKTPGCRHRTPESITPIRHRSTSQDMNSASSTLGAADQANGSRTESNHRHSHSPESQFSKQQVSSSDDLPDSERSTGGSRKLRRSPLSNKKNLQKMLKSLANSDKKAQNVSQSGGRTVKHIEAQKSSINGEQQRENDHREKPDQSSGAEKVITTSHCRHELGKHQMNSNNTSHAAENGHFSDFSDTELSSPPPAQFRPRPYIALYDYDPLTMSPNEDAVDNELGFKMDDIVLVVRDVDEDGFYVGELNGRRGYVPSNMVQEYLNTPTPTTSSERSPKVSPKPAKLRKMVALFDYDPSSLSPNPDSEAELAFKKEDIILVSGPMGEDGFFRGTIGVRHGLVPSNYLKPLD